MNELLAFFNNYIVISIVILAGMLCTGFFVGVGIATRFGSTLYNIFEQAMTQDEVNSRLVFLLHGIVTAVGILMISVMFVFVKDRTGFPVMVGAIGGGGVGAALGRYFTKAGDGKQTPDQKP